MSQISYQKVNQLSIYSANCLNNISPLAQCHSCVDICTRQALSFQDGHWEAIDCTLCGLCTTVCPAQVFQIDQMALLSTHKKQPLQLCCYQNAAAPAEAFPINCLQQLSPLSVLHLLYQCQSVTLYLTPDACQQCKQHWYTGGLLFQLQQYHIPENKLNIIIQSTHATEKPSLGENRRNFIADLFHRTETRSKKALMQTMDSIAANFSSEKEVVESTVFPTRLPLYALYIKKQLPLQAEETLPFRLMSCNNCTFCGACKHICPTSALELLENDRRKQLYFHPELCINCNLCQKICMQHGLQWEEFMTQQQFFNTPHPLAESAEKICTICAEPYYAWPATETTICPRCRDYP